MSISFSPTYIFSSDGSSLSGWTNSGITISSSIGNPAPSFSGAGGATKYAYINPASLSSLVGYTIFIDMYVTGATPMINLYFGCNSSGAGQMFRLDARVGQGSGFIPTTVWATWGGPSTVVSGFTTNTWYKIKIVINSTATNGMSWYYNGVLGTTGTFVDNGGYIAVHGDNGTGGNWDNIAIYPNFDSSIAFIAGTITYSMATSAQFYINVKPDTVVPTRDDTGAFTLTNAGSVTLVTNDATRGKVLSFPNSNGITTDFRLPIIHTRLFWVKLNSTTPNNSTLASGSSRPLYFNGLNYMNFSMNFPGTVYADSTNTVTTGVWYFYALTYDGTTANLYRNGILDYSVNTTSTATTGILGIGVFLDGYLDNIRCYSTALTQTQIQNIYNYELANPTSFYYENGYTIPPSIGYSYIVNPNGLAVYIDFTNPSCYPGSGTTFYNLMDGTAQAITVGSGLSARVSYTSSIGLRLDNSTINNVNTAGVCLSLTTCTVQTISIWYKIYSVGTSQYLCDARTNPPSGSGLTIAGYVYSGGGPFGAGWNTAYVNGGSAIATSTATWAGVVNPTTPTPWRNVTIVSTSSASTYPTIAGRYPKTECLDCAIAFVLVYNRALSQDENTTNYNALLSKMNALS